MKGLLVALAAWTCFGAPDLAPPGMHLVANHVAIDWPDALAPVRFVVAPSQGPQRRHDVVRGEAFSLPRGPFANARLYAVPADAGELPRDAAAWSATGWPSAPLPVRAVHSVSVASAVHRVHTDVLVEAIDGTAIRCRAVRTVQFDREGRPVAAAGVLLPALVALVGVVLLVALARRRATEPA